jgi:hypothetical protein
MHTAPGLPDILVQPPQIRLVVLAREEARLAIVAALNDVQRRLSSVSRARRGMGSDSV